MQHLKIVIAFCLFCICIYRCHAASECPRKQEFHECGNQCPPTCGDPNPSCKGTKCVPGCRCKDGYYAELSENRTLLNCIKPKQCQDLVCPGDQVFKECANPCPRSCFNPNPVCPPSVFCIKKCDCPGDLIDLGNLKCGTEQDCKGGCPAGKQQVQCLKSPCTNNIPECIEFYPGHKCVVNNCGKCTAKWYQTKAMDKEIVCDDSVSRSTRCPEGFVMDKIVFESDYLEVELDPTSSKSKKAKKALLKMKGRSGAYKLGDKEVYRIRFNKEENVLNIDMEMTVQTTNIEQVHIGWFNKRGNEMFSRDIIATVKKQKWFDVSEKLDDWAKVAYIEISFTFKKGKKKNTIKQITGRTCRSTK